MGTLSLRGMPSLCCSYCCAFIVGIFLTFYQKLIRTGFIEQFVPCFHSFNLNKCKLNDQEIGIKVYDGTCSDNLRSTKCYLNVKLMLLKA